MLKKIITIEGTTEALLMSAMNLSRRRSSLLWANKLSISMGWTSTLVDMQDFACNVEDKEKRLVMISWDPLDLSKMSVGGRKEVVLYRSWWERNGTRIDRVLGGWNTLMQISMEMSWRIVSWRIHSVTLVVHSMCRCSRTGEVGFGGGEGGVIVYIRVVDGP